MRRALAVTLSVAVLSGLVDVAPAWAERRLAIDRGPAGPPPRAVRPYDSRFDTLRPVPTRPSDLRNYAYPPARSKHPSFPGHHRAFKGHGHGHGSVIVGSGPVFYWPAYVDREPVYADPPLYSYAPAPSVAVPPPPPPPPMPSVVEHETGHYELRGDGLTVPYMWVWVPKPPAAPPPMAAPPSSPPPAETAPPRRSALYRWTDRDGVVHWTDNVNSVPPEYRSRIQQRSL